MRPHYRGDANANAGLGPEVLAKDREYYLACIREYAEHIGGIANLYYDALAREGEEDRYWCFTAVGRLDIMRAWARRREDAQAAISDGHQPCHG